MLRLFGYGPADLPPNFTGFLARIHPDDWPGFEPSSEGLGGEAEVRVLQPDGSIRWFLIRSYAIPGPDGRRAGLSGTAQDVTERRKLREQLAQAQKMEGVGQLAAGITHDFNNVLSAIQLQADFLLKDPSLTPHQRGALEELASYAMRGAALTRQLLLFSRQRVMQRRIIDLNATIAAFVPMLQRLVGAHIPIRFEPSAALPQFKVDPTMVEQVVMNLVVNARDAMPEGGAISIAIAEVGHLGAAAGPGAKAPPGKYARLSVTDTGTGMSDQIRKRIFEPFFTTKEPGTGTGLGLATVAGVVEQHGGWIQVESEPGRGSTFHVHLSMAGATG
jgi:signal transduction histidine kinase